MSTTIQRDALVDALKAIVQEALDIENGCRDDWNMDRSVGATEGLCASAALDLAITYRERIEGLARPALDLVRGEREDQDKP